MPNNNQTTTNAANVGTNPNPQGTVVPSVEKTPATKTVEVPETVLNDILQKLKDNEVEIRTLRENQQQFEQTASQDQILKIEKLRASGKLVKAVKVNFLDNDMVVGWQSTSDDVYIETGTGKEIAVQKTKLKFANGQEKEVPQLDFARRKMQRQYEVVKEARDRDGNMIFTVLMEGGKEVDIDSRYVN